MRLLSSSIYENEVKIEAKNEVKNNSSNISLEFYKEDLFTFSEDEQIYKMNPDYAKVFKYSEKFDTEL